MGEGTMARPPRPAPQKKRKRTPSLGPPSATKHHKRDDVRPAFLSAPDAASIRTVLESTDTQGLLDRVFPCSHAPDTLLSLRSLLEHPAEHPLTAVKTAIGHLLPISSLPRSRPSDAASQQLDFTSLALSLLQQASFNSIAPPLDTPHVLDVADDSSPVQPKRRYALVQHLPSGDYWSSLSAGTAPSDLKSLPTGNAELVAIIPTASASPLDAVPSLGSISSRPLAPTKPIIGPRRVSTGVFLDYGPYASFAPSFETVAGIVGQRQLSEVVYQREQKKQGRHDNNPPSAYIQEIPEEDDVVMNVAEPEPISDKDLDTLLPPEDVKALKEALGSLELERAVQTLLDRNALALKRLGELQTRRLSNPDVKPVEEGSEEWDTAQTIMDSIATLASLRPRSSAEDGAPLVPSPAVLRKLHRSLALEPSPGWYGNLPASRATALHDDSTIKGEEPDSHTRGPTCTRTHHRGAHQPSPCNPRLPWVRIQLQRNPATAVSPRCRDVRSLQGTAGRNLLPILGACHSPAILLWPTKLRKLVKSAALWLRGHRTADLPVRDLV
ncbi:hypothetical protein FA13DRAFT_443172 [Coprinellus micaceus]|uniref:Uncharacterized protein n=1 Tax=Coprinellus micaceus TaxID=71717 RepID=A0A4Y7TY60_COPMI|nr:hypothetical protein FA13DRAFT_443172 [Coprinellus micaceus]